MFSKQQLRTIYKQKRQELTASQRLKLDDLLLIKFQQLPLASSIENLLTFWPIEQQHEVNTHLYTRYLQYTIPSLQVAYPVIEVATQEMKAVLTDEDTEFVDNFYGIAEPQSPNILFANEIDLVFVPLLAFDESGYRVGYGKGYYDRFLNNCRPDVCKVGFSYFEAVDKIEDTHQYDVPLNYCITPERIYEF